MQVLRCVPFRDLPASVRDALAAAVQAFDRDGSGPLGFAIRRSWKDNGWAIVRFVVAASLLWVSAAAAFGELGADGAVQGWAHTLWYTALLAMIVALPLAFWPLHQQPRLPFRPGVFFFAGAVVDARSPWIDVHPVDTLKKFQVTHVQRGRNYDHTAISLVFADGRGAVFRIHGQEKAEAALARLREKTAAFQSAGAAQDWASFRALDPFFDLRVAGAPQFPAGGKPRRLLQQLLAAPTAAAIVLGFVLAQPLWLARNLASDQRIYDAAVKQGTEAGYLRYVQTGWRHVAAAQAALPGAALNDAIRTNTVSALRDVLKRYPAAGLQAQVAERVSRIYAQAFDRFKARPDVDPALLPFVQKLLKVLESSGNSAVVARFTRRDISGLERFDQRDLRKYKVALEPVSGHFGSAGNGVRERRIIDEMARGFRAVFPEDVLKLVPLASAAPGRPTLEIDYEIKPSGSVYTSEKTLMNFVGVVMRFDIRLDVPNEPRPWLSSLEVQPPQRFQVRSQGAMPTVGMVYTEMADRAFDFLGEKLRTAFFGRPPGSR